MTTVIGATSWFDQTARANFEKFLLPLADREMRCLQLGIFKGTASVWLLAHLPRAILDDVDPFTGAEKIEDYDYDEIEAEYRRAVEPFGHRCRTHILTSAGYFSRSIALPMFDFVYVDGEHLAPTVLSDAIHSFERLRVGGLMAFDDYWWDSHRGDLHNPKIAVDAFCAIYAERLEVLEVGHQVWIRRTS